MIRLITTIALLLTVCQSLADEYVCRHYNEVRIVSVEYEHKGWDVPCKVKYEKQQEGTVEYPWTAQATPGYCEDRAEFLAGKLENWGWDCRVEPSDD